MTQQVYFAECAGRIKIGYAADVRKRLSAISCGNPMPVVLLGTIAGGRAVELAIHKKLAPHRIRREWFNDCAEVRALLADVQTQGLAPLAGFYKEPRKKTEPKPIRSDAESAEQHPIMVHTRRLVSLLEHPVLIAARGAIKAETRLGAQPGSLFHQALSGRDDCILAYLAAIRCLKAADDHLTFLANEFVSIAADMSGDVAAQEVSTQVISASMEKIVDEADAEITRLLTGIIPRGLPTAAAEAGR